MNQKSKSFSSFLILASLLSGCATGSITSHTGPGFIYTDHYEADLVTANQVGRKRGQSCTENVLGLVTWGDASMTAAMKNGGITVVSSVDRYYHSVLSMYGKMCVIVTGI
jgi:hypothetical protein